MVEAIFRQLGELEPSEACKPLVLLIEVITNLKVDDLLKLQRARQPSMDGLIGNLATS
jgi:hypothetical protein